MKSLNLIKIILFFCSKLCIIGCNAHKLYMHPSSASTTNVQVETTPNTLQQKEITCANITCKQTFKDCFSSISRFLIKENSYAFQYSETEGVSVVMEKPSLLLISVNLVIQENIISGIDCNTEEEEKAKRDIEQKIEELCDQNEVLYERLNRFSNIGLIEGSNDHENYNRIINLLNNPSCKELLLFYHVKLFGNIKVMEKYTAGGVKEPLYSIKMLTRRWYPRWRSRDPYAPFVIFLKNDLVNKTDLKPIGHVVVGHGSNPGQAEAAIVINDKHWRQRYAEQVTSAISETYVSILKQYPLDGARIHTIKATASRNNLGSIRLCEKAGAVNLGYKENVYGNVGKEHFSQNVSYSCFDFLHYRFLIIPILPSSFFKKKSKITKGQKFSHLLAKFVTL